MIIDFHTHIFPPEMRRKRERYIRRDRTFGALYANPKAQIASADDLLAQMDTDGVDVSVVMGIGWADYGAAREANDYIIDAVRNGQGRIVGFAGVNPAWDIRPAWDARTAGNATPRTASGGLAAREAERCADAGLRGIGELHPDTQGFDLADKSVMAGIMAVAQERRLIVTTHSSEPVGHSYTGKGSVAPQVLMRFIGNFPDATIVCAHWGGGLPFYALMPEVAAALRNVYFDSAASPFLYTPEIYPTVCRLVGADKALFGSDYALLRPRRLLGEMASSALTAADRAALQGGNAARLLGLDGGGAITPSQ